MLRNIKNLVINTPLERSSRRLHRYLFGKFSKKIRNNYETVQVMKRRLVKTSNCIDIGCHKGVILDEILSIAPRGKHYAFEPIPELYHRLKEKFPTVSCYDLALSDKKGTTEFFDVTTRRGISGLRRRDLDAAEEVKTITVRTDTIDNIIPEDVQIDYIKIDVEGAELLVLRGALQTLIRCKPLVIFEFERSGANSYNVSSRNMFQLLEGTVGLKISTLAGWLRGESALSAGAFEEEFIKGKNNNFVAHT